MDLDLENHRCGESGKVKFSLRKTAKRASKELGKMHGKVFSVYRCHACAKFHLRTRTVLALKG